jgi:hypothetical protein
VLIEESLSYHIKVGFRQRCEELLAVILPSMKADAVARNLEAGGSEGNDLQFLQKPFQRQRILPAIFQQRLPDPVPLGLIEAAS